MLLHGARQQTGTPVDMLHTAREVLMMNRANLDRIGLIVLDLVSLPVLLMKLVILLLGAAWRLLDDVAFALLTRPAVWYLMGACLCTSGLVVFGR